MRNGISVELCCGSLEDCKTAQRVGADGIVFGFLTADGCLDYERCARFLECTGECETIFHRAIDVTAELPRSAEKPMRSPTRAPSANW